MTCPICEKPSIRPYQPFCSKRCADIDLGRWLNGSYAIETDEAPEPVSDREPTTGRSDEIH